jgi:hypothetical protein
MFVETTTTITLLTRSSSSNKPAPSVGTPRLLLDLVLRTPRIRPSPSEDLGCGASIVKEATIITI